jgi:hypothetical protein
MNSALAKKSWAVEFVTGLSIFVAMLAFAFNAFLVFSIFDGKRLIDKVESEAGRKLSGYELYSEHREVNDYFYPDRELQGDVLYWSSAITTPWGMAPWIVVSLGCLVVFIRMFWNRREMRVSGFGLLGLMICLLGVVISQLGLIEKIAWAIE